MKLIYTFFLSLAAVALFAQAPCQPDPMYADTIGVFPAPFDAEANPDGGITEAACIGEPYEFVLTAVIGDTLSLSGVPVVLDSLVIVSVDGLPAGLDFGCSTDNCVVTTADTAACLVISGTPDETNEAGVYPLVLNAIIYSGFVELELTFPNPLIAPGTYDLTLNAMGECEPSNVFNSSQAGFGFGFAPNPVMDFGELTIEVPQAGEYEYVIYNLLGRAVQRQQLRLQAGVNRQLVDVQNLPKGIYLHSMQYDNERVTKRLIVH